MYIHKAKIDETVMRNRKRHNYFWRLQYPLSIIDTTTIQKISKHIEDLNNTINKPDLLFDIYRALYPIATKYTLFISTHKMVTKIDHVLGHKTSFNKIKRI